MSNLQYTVQHVARMRRIPGFLAWNRLVFKREYPSLARDVFGLRFPHPLGLAPVLDRQADLLDACSSLGYAFSGIIPGDTPVSLIADRLAGRKSSILASVELRADGPTEEQARQNLIRTYSLLYDFTDYFVLDLSRKIGISSLDDISDWKDILDEILELRLCYEKYRPVILRLPPENDEEQTARALDYCMLSGIDGVIASGLQKVRQIVRLTKGRLPVIGSGMGSTLSEPADMLQAGASLVEIAQGIPGHRRTTVRRILQALDKTELKP